MTSSTRNAGYWTHDRDTVPEDHCVAASETYEIVVNGDRAEAYSEEAALLAARTLVNDQAERGGNRRLLTAEIIITKGGVYDRVATVMARAGRTT